MVTVSNAVILICNIESKTLWSVVNTCHIWASQRWVSTSCIKHYRNPRV